MSLRHSHASSHEETMHAHYQSSKAKFRPGKRPPPTLLARAASLVSLPSPPADAHGSSDVEMEHTEDEDEFDQLASDNDDEEATHQRAPHGAPNPCLLGSPANFLGAPAGAAISASRKQLLNPFLPPAVGGGGGESSLRAFPGAPLSPSSSPVRPERQNLSPSRRRHRSDPDRIKLSAEAVFPLHAAAGVTTTPPSKARQFATNEAEQKRDEQEERRRAMGWYDEDNPFVDRNDDMARRLQNKEPLTRPETVTWVKRGQRVATTIPFSALLTSDSPSDDPFTFTAPKLLFPPQTPPSPTPATLPATPARQSKFLEALKAAGTSAVPPQQQLPPTPATLKRRAPPPPAAAADRGAVAPGAANILERTAEEDDRAGRNKRLRTLGSRFDQLPACGLR